MEPIKVTVYVATGDENIQQQVKDDLEGAGWGVPVDLQKLMPTVRGVCFCYELEFEHETKPPKKRRGRYK